MQLIQFAGVPEEKPANAASVPSFTPAHHPRKLLVHTRKTQNSIQAVHDATDKVCVCCWLCTKPSEVFMKSHADSEDGYFPILIEYSTGQQQVCKTVNDVPCGVTFKVIETNYQSEVCQ